LRFLAVITLIIAGLVACQSPKEQAFAPASHPAALKEKAVIAVDGTPLRLQKWLPAENPPKAVILALHGFNDYSNTFASLGEYVQKEGIALYAYDQRGYGTSGEWGIWAGKENLVRDVATVSTLVARRHPDVPFYVAGESMGGAVVMIASARRVLSPEVKGLILFAPAVWGDAFMPWWYRAPLWIMAHTIPASRFSGRGLGYVPSDNEEMLRALGRDPLIIKKSRIDTVYGVRSVMDAAYASAAQVMHPTLLLYGAHDDIIPAPPMYDVMRQMQHEGQRVAYYPHGYHMLTRDLQQEVVHRDVAVWVLSGGENALPSAADKEPMRRMKEELQ
jgi:alpha-beta hydrolase superfamily lysophospholipase